MNHPQPVSTKPAALCLLDERLRQLVFDPRDYGRMADLLEFVAGPQAPADGVRLPEALRNRVRVIVGSWGLPRLDREFLALFPSLEIVFYAAGSVRDKVTSESWRKPVRIVTAAAANAIPVAEYAFAQIILGLKQAWPAAQAIRRGRRFMRPPPTVAGTFRRTIALLGFGHTGRLVRQRLRSLEVTVLVHDPLLPAAEAKIWDVEPCTLEDAFARAEVVSCHLPLLPATESLLEGRHFRLMKPGGVFINTARGGVVAEAEMIEVLRTRPDLTALLDVVQQETDTIEQPPFDLPNVFITPHVAGSLGSECQRFGRLLVEEMERYVQGRPLQHEVDPGRFEFSA